MSPRDRLIELRRERALIDQKIRILEDRSADPEILRARYAIQHGDTKPVTDARQALLLADLRTARKPSPKPQTTGARP